MTQVYFQIFSHSSAKNFSTAKKEEEVSSINRIFVPLRAVTLKIQLRTYIICCVKAQITLTI